MSRVAPVGSSRARALLKGKQKDNEGWWQERQGALLISIANPRTFTLNPQRATLHVLLAPSTPSLNSQRSTSTPSPIPHPPKPNPQNPDREQPSWGSLAGLGDHCGAAPAERPHPAGLLPCYEGGAGSGIRVKRLAFGVEGPSFRVQGFRVRVDG